MNVVLLSGGSGKRLWPLSNETMSKQFLKLLPGPGQNKESMVQRVYRQIGDNCSGAHITVSTNAAQVGIIRSQIGDDVVCVVEPQRRDTYPAIALAAAHLRYEQGKKDDDAMIVLPIDVFADNEYFQLLKQIEAALCDNKHEIMLMGAIPTYPSAKYGYVIAEQNALGSVKKVVEFKEKPDAQEAQRWIENGALWNCGVFGMKIGHILDAVRREVSFNSFTSLREQYDKLTKNSFDYEVVEKAASIGIITYEGRWKDLGTWNTLTEEMESNIVGGNVLIADTCQNTHVLNMLDTPIITMGLRDSVVVASHDGILVSDKYQSSFLKPLADQVKNRPMYEQRIWGNYRVIDRTETDGQTSLTKRMHMKRGKELSCQSHAKRQEVWAVISGTGEFTLDGKTFDARSGSVFNIPIGAIHKMKALTDLEFIEVQIGSASLDEDDIVRY